MSWSFGRHRSLHVRRLLLAILLLSVGLAHPSAHNVAPEPTVEVFLRATGERLAVQVWLPILALADANLPRNTDGHFVQSEIGPALDLVARGIARDLEIEQGDDLLPMPAIATTLSPDESFVALDLQYVVRADRTDLSARFHPFRGGGQFLRTQAHYVVDDRTTRTFVIAGDPERVTLDPSAVQALQHFVAHGTDTLLSGIDFFLFALCVIAAPRGRRALMSACLALLAGETLTMVLSSMNVVQVTPVALLAAQATGASVIVIAALQDVVNPESRWLSPLAFVFGTVNGIEIGSRFLSESSFAGAHVMVGLFTCLLVLALGQTWILALLSSAAGLVRRRGRPAQFAVLALSLFAGHAALHSLADRGQELADGGIVPLDRFLLTVTLAWAAVILCAGILDVALFSRLRVFSRPTLAEAGKIEG
jgi:hypothetical protein